jgi:hypothetical protein
LHDKLGDVSIIYEGSKMYQGCLLREDQLMLRSILTTGKQLRASFNTNPVTHVPKLFWAGLKRKKKY